MIALAIVAAALIGYTLLARRLQTTILSGPLIFVAFGVLISQQGLGLFTLDLGEDEVTILLKSTLVILLFTEASHLKVRTLDPEAGLPARLLFIAMPLAMAVGAAGALVIFGDLGVWEAAVLAAVLAPTDAALGQPVVSNPAVPGTVRRTLIVESGLNDGLAVPFAFGFAAAAEFVSTTQSRATFVEFLFDQVVFGVLIGLAVGWLGAKAFNLASSRRWSNDGWLQIGFLGLAALAFALAEAKGIDGNGFIAAWVAGLAFGRAKNESLHPTEFAERVGDLLTLVSFLVFGALLLAPILGHMEWTWVVYALFSLAVVRPIAVALSMIASGLRLPTVVYMGWFGPRGIATVILVLLVIKKFTLLHAQEITDVMTIVVAASVVLHGVTARTGSQAYAGWIRTNGTGPLDHYASVDSAPDED